MNMNNFEFKKSNPPITPEKKSLNTPEDVSSELVVSSSKEKIQDIEQSIEKKKMDKDPYFDWMMNEIKNNKSEPKNFNTNASEFIKYIIDTESEDYGEEGLDKALRMIEEDAYLNYLEPRILTLKGEYEKALDSIIGSKLEENYFTTSESLLFLLKNNRNQKDEIMKKVQDQNPGLMHFIESSYSL